MNKVEKTVNDAVDEIFSKIEKNTECLLCGKDIWSGIWIKELGLVCIDCAIKEKYIDKTFQIYGNVDYQAIAKKIITKKVVEKL